MTEVATYRNTDLAMTAIIRRYRADLFTVTQYDDAFGTPCKTERFECLYGALNCCMAQGFNKKVAR